MIKLIYLFFLRNFLDVTNGVNFVGCNLENLVHKFHGIFIVSCRKKACFFGVIYMTEPEQSVFSIDFLKTYCLSVEYEVEFITYVVFNRFWFLFYLVDSFNSHWRFFEINWQLLFVLLQEKLVRYYDANLCILLSPKCCKKKSNKRLSLACTKLQRRVLSLFLRHHSCYKDLDFTNLISS